MLEFHQPPNVFVKEVNVKVADLERSVQFYEQIIGLKILKKVDQKVVFTTNGNTPLLTIEQPLNVTAKQGRMTGLYHFALLIPTRLDLAIFLRHLLIRNYRFGGADHAVSEAIYLSDPDGNGIEVYCDRPADEWVWKNGKVKMVSDPLHTEQILMQSDMKWNGLPNHTKMGHIHLHVADLQKSEQFYTKGLGFTTVSYYPQAVFLSTGGYHHHIAINTWNGVGAPTPPKNHIGLNWYTIAYPDEEARKKAVQQLKQIHAPIKKEADYIETIDPSGNEIRLVI